MTVYTKTGDKGKTGTASGKRVSKASKLIQAIGAIDELNSYLGIIGKLIDIQRNLFTINSMLSGAKLNLPKDAVKKLGIKGYNDECRSIVQRFTGEWEKTITRIGRWVDFENDYKTTSKCTLSSASKNSKWNKVRFLTICHF